MSEKGRERFEESALALKMKKGAMSKGMWTGLGIRQGKKRMFTWTLKKKCLPDNTDF